MQEKPILINSLHTISGKRAPGSANRPGGELDQIQFLLEQVFFHGVASRAKPNERLITW
jgi:hypothetical protein